MPYYIQDSLVVTDPIYGNLTGSLQGTASYSTITISATSASYAATASLAPNYVLISNTASMLEPYVLTSQTSSMSVLSSSYSVTADTADTITINSFGDDIDSYLLMANILATPGVAIGGDNNLKYNSSTNILTVENISATTLTGSLQGTSSWATNFVSASNYVLNSVTSSMLAPYVLTSATASMLSPYVLTSSTSSMLTPYLLSSLTSSFATTGSNTFIGNQIITGSVIISSSADPQFVIGNNLLRVSSSGQLGVSGSIVPNVHNTYTLGTSTVRFQTLFVQGTINSNTVLCNNLNMGASTPMSIFNNNSLTVAQWYGQTANLRMQSGSTPAYVDNGYRLQINSLGAVSGGFYITGSTNQSLIRVDAPGSSSILLVSSSGRVSVNGGLTLNGSDIDTAWTSYTPSWTTPGTQPTLGDGTLTGAYKQIGKTVFVRVRLVFGTTTSGGTGDWQFGLPVTASNAAGIQFPCSILDAGNAWYQATVNGQYSGFTDRTSIIGQSSGANSSQGITSTFPITWGNTDSLQFNGSYESI